jgi:long-chain fatty acid transport protein
VDAKLRGFTPIHLHAAWNFEDLGLSAAFSVYNPFGLGVFWPGDWDGRFLATETDMTTFFLQPALAVDVAKLAGFKDSFKLSVSLGYDLILAQAVLARRIDLRVAEMLVAQDIVDPEGEMKLTGDAMGHGMIASLYAELPDLVAFGACWRFGFGDDLQMPLPFSGTGKFWFNQAGERALEVLATRIPDETQGELTLNLPMSVNLGVAFLGVENLVVDVDFFYAFYETYKELVLEYDCVNEDPPCDLNLDPLVANWTNAWQISFGAQYTLFDMLDIRAGYGYVTTPVPDETLDPTLPDGPKHLITVGAGLTFSWWKLDVGYMLSLWSAEKDNEVGTWDPATNSPNGLANGSYDSLAHLLGLSFTFLL